MGTRRNFIKTGAVAGATLLAGCSNSGDDPHQVLTMVAAAGQTVTDSGFSTR
ncbi:twin-arginine translocation signal domain-containing protein [Haladaptatus pallidirubidus]|uniref:twin-arginine translocation signal domain-containing protein n=1 Tax=Haladaptatus pallidirubidus TaxID=1008152 RepID=UPI0036F3458A